MLRAADDIRSIARRAADPDAASLRIGLIPTLAPYLLPHVVPDLHERFPKVELLLVEEKTEVVLQRLREARLDAGLPALPVPDEHLHVEPLFEEDLPLAVPCDPRPPPTPPLATPQGPPAQPVAPPQR